MKMLFKQRAFSWFDSYNIYDENGGTLFTVQGRPAWGHRLEIYNANGDCIAELKERVFSFRPKFEIYIGGGYVGQITKEITFFKPSFSVDCNGWTVGGDFWQWDYQIYNSDYVVATIEKQLFNWTDTYVIDVVNSTDSLLALMVTLAIDAVKCSQNG